MEVWSAMLRSAISMLLRQERYLKSSEPPQKNVSVKCGKKKKVAGESEEALLEEIMDEMEDDSMETENEDA